MNLFEFLETIDRDIWSFDAGYYITKVGYLINKRDALLWARYKLDNGIMTEGEYLKELLMISKSNGMVDYGMDGRIILWRACTE